MRYYVAADVHGFYDKFMEKLTEAGFFRDPEPHKLVVCGDLFDRGEGTLQLQEDEKGLFGTIQVNPNDRSAMDLYERVSRGDVDGCSFGFDIRAEETELRDDGTIHWTMTDIDLGEVSCCTFPAYQETNIEARAEDAANLKKREVEALKEKLKNKLKEEE